MAEQRPEGQNVGSNALLDAAEQLRLLTTDEGALSAFVRKHHKNCALVFRHLQHEHTTYARQRRAMLLSGEIHATAPNAPAHRQDRPQGGTVRVEPVVGRGEVE